MKRTYIDAGVLIAAARGTTNIAIRSLEFLSDPERELASSIFVKLEVLPKAVYYQNAAEVDFYEAFFNSVSYCADPNNQLIEAAYQQACNSVGSRCSSCSSSFICWC